MYSVQVDRLAAFVIPSCCFVEALGIGGPSFFGIGGWKMEEGWGGGTSEKWPPCGGGDSSNGNGSKWHGIQSCDANLTITAL